MFDSNSHDDAERECAVGGGASLAGGTADAQPRPRVVTTGRKKVSERHPVDSSEIFGAGERIELQSGGPSGIRVTRHLDPVETAPANVAFLDALAFSVVPPDEKSYTWVLQEMQQFLAIETVEYSFRAADDEATDEVEQDATRLR